MILEREGAKAGKGHEGLMATVTLRVMTPKGYLMDVEIDPETKGADIEALLEKAEKLAHWFVGRGWGFADAQPGQAALAGGQKALAAAAGPSFCGYPCSPILDAEGFPAWVMDGEKRAILHKKNGDNWYSCDRGEKKWSKACLAIKAGQTKPPVMGLPVA